MKPVNRRVRGLSDVVADDDHFVRAEVYESALLRTNISDGGGNKLITDYTKPTGLYSDMSEFQVSSDGDEDKS